MAAVIYSDINNRRVLGAGGGGIGEGEDWWGHLITSCSHTNWHTIQNCTLPLIFRQICRISIQVSDIAAATVVIHHTKYYYYSNSASLYSAPSKLKPVNFPVYDDCDEEYRKWTLSLHNVCSSVIFGNWSLKNQMLLYIKLLLKCLPIMDLKVSKPFLVISEKV